MSSCNTRFTMSIPSLHLQMLILLSCFATIINAVQSDIDCLKSIKESLQDPENLLSSWDFIIQAEGSICQFPGIECWHPDESKVLNIRLSHMGLRGPFPMGIRHCTSLTGLDLSSNYLTGSLPSDLADILPFTTSLDLSSNNLSGPIPPSIGNLSFINLLRLDNNQLTGQIPPELGELHRIKEFSVANNRLSGPVPKFLSRSLPEASYANNPGLCGGPLSPSCNNDDLFFLGFAVGCPVSTILSTLFILYCLPRLSMSNMRHYLLMKKKGIKNHMIPSCPQILVTEENSSQEINKVTGMAKYIRLMSLVELETATDYFDSKNVIGYGNMGIMYKAVFPNGLTLAGKRLHKFESFEKEFLLDIEILSRLRHTNVVPLLSFCFEMDKKFLVYKYMSNGTLHQWLHSRLQVGKMGWTLRFKIALGIARGLAWLHHNNVLQVAHLKINSNCILLDDKFEPKISNFGYSKILMNTTSTPSNGSNFQGSKFSPTAYKEDVYSFGILLLELISGREPSRINSPRHADFNVVDECLMGQGSSDEIHETLRIAENCIQSYNDGAASMLQVYQSMHDIGVSRNESYVNLCMDVEDDDRDV